MVADVRSLLESPWVLLFKRANHKPHTMELHKGDSVGSSPAVADGRVYVGSWDGKAYCLDASTGAFIWSYATGSYLRSLTTLLFCLKSIPFS